ncbi:MAG: hypothetical protein WBG11_13140 [Methylocella sp.]
MGTTSHPEDVEALAAAMSQVLDDMRKDGISVCLATKAQARIAYEPFADPGEKEFIMPIEEARRIIEELS